MQEESADINYTSYRGRWGAENDGPSKLQGMKLQGMKLQDMKMQDMKLQDMTNISLLLKI